MVQRLKSVADIIQQKLGTQLDMNALFEIELEAITGAVGKK